MYTYNADTFSDTGSIVSCNATTLSYTAASVMQCRYGATMSDTMSTVLCYAATMSFNAAGVRDYIATIFDRFHSIVTTVTTLLKLCYSCQALPLHLLSMITAIWVAHKKDLHFKAIIV